MSTFNETDDEFFNELLRKASINTAFNYNQVKYTTFHYVPTPTDTQDSKFQEKRTPLGKKFFRQFFYMLIEHCEVKKPNRMH